MYIFTFWETVGYFLVSICLWWLKSIKGHSVHITLQIYVSLIYETVSYKEKKGAYMILHVLTKNFLWLAIFLKLTNPEWVAKAAWG